jgi:aminopeptidase
VIDARVERLADLVLDHSLGLREGQLLRIDAEAVAAPLVAAVHRAAVERGAFAYANVELEGFPELMVAEGSREQLEYIAALEWAEMDRLDALLTVWSETSTRSLSRADPERHTRYLATRRRLSRRRGERVARGEMSWCGTLFPTDAHAQDAEMSLREYEEFVYRACHVQDGDNAVEHWGRVGEQLEARANALAGTRELRIVGPDTDLRLGVADRTWLAARGLHNMPDGEIYTSPVETETEGDVRYTLPAIFNGREVRDVRLRFENGRVVDASAESGGDYLDALLDMDGGARVLGEVAFGLNYEIAQFTRNILFDEKIGGTIHLALGSAFREAGGRNESGLHWDMICDLREDGEVYADGELIWRAGRFVGDHEGPRG